MQQFLLIIFLGIGLTNMQAQEARERINTIRISDSVFCMPVQDQSNSPTCWAFGTNSVIESDLWRKKKKLVNFSEMFIARYAYIDKAEKYLSSGGKTYFEGGGQFHDVIRVIQRFGIVPELVYSGKTRLQKNHDHAALDTAMQHLVKHWQRNGRLHLTPKDIAQLNDTLNKYLGKIPASFMYKGKKYTPKSFAKEFVPFIHEYVELVSFSGNTLYTKMELKDKYNWAADSLYNITIADMQMITDTALHNGWSLGWEGDVTNKDFMQFTGIASMENSTMMLDSVRQYNYTKEYTERDHMLQLVGTGKDAQNKKWYYLKNSWGNYNRFKGFLYMDENYFKYNTVILFVNKNALPKSIRNQLKGLKP